LYIFFIKKKLIIYIVTIDTSIMPKSRVGIQPFAKFMGTYYWGPLHEIVVEWLIHTLANFEHHRKSTFVNEIFRLAGFTEEQKQIATSRISEAVFTPFEI